jgi:hypothetical protein
MTNSERLCCRLWPGFQFIALQKPEKCTSLLFLDTLGPETFFAILKGASRPVVLRKHNDYYEHVGACYVHGLIDGEAAELLKAGSVKVETARIK